jgi:hypothetical protein
MAGFIVARVTILLNITINEKCGFIGVVVHHIKKIIDFDANHMDIHRE